MLAGSGSQGDPCQRGVFAGLRSKHGEMHGLGKYLKTFSLLIRESYFIRSYHEKDLKTAIILKKCALKWFDFHFIVEI
jgi:hypothetical protein